MQVQVQLFSILRDCLPPGAQRGLTAVLVPDGATLKDLIVQLGIDQRLRLEAGAVASGAGWQITVNGRFEPDVERVLQDGDQVRIFPPVAGGQ